MLKLTDISFQVDGSAASRKEILKNIDLAVDDKKFLVITGPNGGGKSTLAKIIAGIEKPTSGSIFFDGKEITSLTVNERADLGMAYAFQQPVRFKGLTVRDLLELAAKDNQESRPISDYLCDVGLCAPDYLDREVNASLSGGEIKRIEIAMAMARKSKLTIFDEPEAGIDLWSFNNLIDIFKRLREESGGSIIIISHQERILEIADEIVVLSSGKITAQGKREDILPTLLAEEHAGFCPMGKGGQAHE